MSTYLLSEVENNNLDAGLILQAGFDADVAAGNQPFLQFYVGGESLASNRIILAVTTLDLIREVADAEPNVVVDVVTIGEEGLELSVRSPAAHGDHGRGHRWRHDSRPPAWWKRRSSVRSMPSSSPRRR